jgi:hypothetical protein
VTFDDLLKHFVRSLQDVRYPAKLKLSLGEQTTKALATRLAPITYNSQDFCTAINGAKNELERAIGKRMKIRLGCSHIGIAAGDDVVPELAEEPKGWRSGC